jgi:polar amino acid transport system substrate-binding protein
MGGRKVCAAAGTTSLQKIKDAPSKPVPYPVPNVTDCMVALQDGVVEGIVNDEMVLAGMALQDPRTEIVGTKEPFDEPIAVAISKKNPELTRFVNGVLAQAMQDGTWRKIHEKWFGKIRAAPPPAAPRYRD